MTILLEKPHSSHSWHPVASDTNNAIAAAAIGTLHCDNAVLPSAAEFGKSIAEMSSHCAAP